MLVISACLVGVKCKYNGEDNYVPALAALVEQGRALPVCPEQLGGLGTPRPPAEIQGADGAAVLVGEARVVTATGDDVTAAFLQGARETLRLAQLMGAEQAVLKEGSPACGSGRIYDGSFQGQKKAGQGVAAALLRQQGLQVCSEQDFIADPGQRSD